MQGFVLQGTAHRYQLVFADFDHLGLVGDHAERCVRARGQWGNARERCARRFDSGRQRSWVSEVPALTEGLAQRSRRVQVLPWFDAFGQHGGASSGASVNTALITWAAGPDVTLA